MVTGAKRKLAEYRRKRDFSRTPGPSGDGASGGGQRKRSTLRFIIQKHAASHLHFDFRLELDGVMKSWAIPKGPSLDPSVKRLAMEVEDHPISYNEFEGIIPKGQYGGGTVMLWDTGTYDADDPGGTEAVRRGYRAGRLDFTLHGRRLQGSFALLRTRRDEGKPQWLLIKQRDDHAAPGRDIVAEAMTSVVSDRTMEQIASGADAVWQSNRAARDEPIAPRPTRRAPPFPRPSSLLPMYASIGTDVPTGDRWTFEPKYDGVRVLAWATAERVQLITRNGKDKAAQFPEVTAALRTLASRRGRRLVLDGEIVALGSDGAEPARFQALQTRMHVKDADTVAGHASSTPAALIAFDIVVDDDESLIAEPWTVRRRRLEQRIGKRPPTGIRLGDSSPGDGRAMLER